MNITAEGVLAPAVYLLDCKEVLMIDSFFAVEFFNTGFQSLVGVKHEAFQTVFVTSLELLKQCEFVMAFFDDLVALLEF